MLILVRNKLNRTKLKQNDRCYIVYKSRNHDQINMAQGSVFDH